MNTMQKVRESVQKYLSEMPKDVLQQKLDRFNKMDFEGISMSEYLQSLEQFNAQLNNAPIIQLRMAQFREPLWNQMPTKLEISTLFLLNRSNPITKPHFNHIKNLALAA
jgi:hypothetical protein